MRRWPSSAPRHDFAIALADAKSDIDVLVDIVADVHGFDYFGLLEDLRRALSELLDRHVHVVDSANLQRIKERVLQDAIPL